MNGSSILTIYTATYNRATLLERLYESLRVQTVQNFVWLIIDDGSKDNTAELVKKWSSQSLFQIQYCYKKNGGVHTARQMAYSMINTELLVGIDSDDYVKETFVEQITQLWTEKGGENYCGILSATEDRQGKRIVQNFPLSVPKATWQEWNYMYGCIGDHTLVIRTDIMKSMEAFPQFDGEKLVGEGFKWIQLPDLPLIINHIPLTVVEYIQGGISSTNGRLNIIRSPQGAQANANMHLKHLKYFRPRIKACIKYIICSFYLNDIHFINKSNRPILTAILTPIGFIAYLVFKNRYGVGENE